MNQLLLIDNYDSFVYNLARYFHRLGVESTVVRNDRIDVPRIRELAPSAIVLSPGPCTPFDAGCSLDIVRQLATSLPILGVCLGHQAIAAALGATIVRAPQPMHGRTSLVQHDQQGVFADVPNPLVVCRYHSLVVDPATVPAELEITATTDDGVVMGLRHRTLPIVGLQFHPESILTEHGYRLLAGFLRIAGMVPLENIPTIQDERDRAAGDRLSLPARPVTF